MIRAFSRSILYSNTKLLIPQRTLLLRAPSIRLLHNTHFSLDKSDEDIQKIRKDIEKYRKLKQQDDKDIDWDEYQKKINESLRKLEEKAHKEQEEENESTIKNNKNKTNDELNEENIRKKLNETNPFVSPSQDPSNNINLFQLGLTFFLLSFLLDLYNGNGNAKEISWQDFYKDYLSKQMVKQLVVVNNSWVKIILFNNDTVADGGYLYFNIGSLESFEENLINAQDQLQIDNDSRVPVTYVRVGQLSRIIWQILPTVVMITGLIWLTTRSTTMTGPNGNSQNGIFSLSRSKAKRFNVNTDVKIKFKDVAGCDEAKEEIMELVSFLKNPQRYERMGAKIPRGAILSGPPGTGKTLLAKATAGEANVPFYFVSGSEFVEMFVGVGAARVRDLFKTARENAPSIVFIDEIDAIGKARQKGNFSGANDERENTLNQMLVEMDGFTPSDHVVVLAGTNRPDILDQALMRPGRFDRHINIDNPELEGRKDIFAVHLKGLKLHDSIFDLKNRLAALTPGFSGADIANTCNEAALIAARFNSDTVKLTHFEQAIERVIAGVERQSKILSPEEKKIVAYHEAGHAICGWFLKYADPLLKVSIIPRGQGALGYAQYLPGDIYLLNEQQLRDRITMALGGRVSEELHFDSVTGGAADDFKKVTQMATTMVTQLGMSKRIGWLSYDKKDDQDLTRAYSDDTGNAIDEEVHKIIRDAHTICKNLLKEKATELEKIAQLLLTKEVLTREDMINILGKRPFPERNDAFDKYLNGKPATVSPTTT